MRRLSLNISTPVDDYTAGAIHWLSANEEFERDADQLPEPIDVTGR